MLASYKSQLLLGTGAEAFSYAASGLVDKGVLEILTVSARAVRRDAYAQSDAGFRGAPARDHRLHLGELAGGSQYSVFDTATGQPIVSGVSLGATAFKPKALAIGQYVVIVFYDTSHEPPALRGDPCDDALDADRGGGLRDRSGDHPDFRLHGHRRHQRRSVRHLREQLRRREQDQPEALTRSWC
jgi:hypothetical protein